MGNIDADRFLIDVYVAGSSRRTLRHLPYKFCRQALHELFLLRFGHFQEVAASVILQGFSAFQIELGAHLGDDVRGGVKGGGELFVSLGLPIRLYRPFDSFGIGWGHDFLGFSFWKRSSATLEVAHTSRLTI